eukprot:2620312-Amphidinium_carterae.2
MLRVTFFSTKILTQTFGEERSGYGCSVLGSGVKDNVSVLLGNKEGLKFDAQPISSTVTYCGSMNIINSGKAAQEVVELISSEPALIATSPMPGGGKGMLFPPFPPWNSQPEKGAVRYRVSTPNDDVHDLVAPISDQSAVEAMIAEHLSLGREWVHFQWESKRHVRLKWQHKTTTQQAIDEIRALARPLLKRGAKRARTQTRTATFGVRVSRIRGITVATTRARAYVMDLNRVLRASLPFSTWTSFSIVEHNGVDMHEDTMNSPFAWHT